MFLFPGHEVHRKKRNTEVKGDYAGCLKRQTQSGSLVQRVTTQLFAKQTQSRRVKTLVFRKIENVEFFWCGQSGLLGGYPMHVHKTLSRHEDVVLSYVRKNVVHKSFQRAVTVHETEYFSVTEISAFDVMGVGSRR